MKEVTKTVQAWNLVDFLQGVVEATSEGYVLDLETNLNYPQMIGHFFTVVMVLAEQETALQEVLEDSSEDGTTEALKKQEELVVQKRGRVAKVKTAE